MFCCVARKVSSEKVFCGRPVRCPCRAFREKAVFVHMWARGLFVLYMVTQIYQKIDKGTTSISSLRSERLFEATCCAVVLRRFWTLKFVAVFVATDPHSCSKFPCCGIWCAPKLSIPSGEKMDSSGLIFFTDRTENNSPCMGLPVQPQTKVNLVCKASTINCSFCLGLQRVNRQYRSQWPGHLASFISPSTPPRGTKYKNKIAKICIWRFERSCTFACQKTIHVILWVL